MSLCLASESGAGDNSEFERVLPACPPHGQDWRSARRSRHVGSNLHQAGRPTKRLGVLNPVLYPIFTSVDRLTRCRPTD
ncbi:hypothetical protein M407DRAFT_124509 [Tulasnella calospora MUT 4182]|uniref:Uncharacterized protein n=1 Tax=Tulasnella calospora MUT 4182 TaxID=1051891 RepID=A0A0C3QIC3_9AGAM|nr:hypothetical protein M407DRAFT_124509 [Tulasnella calospora MUT 4182]